MKGKIIWLEVKERDEDGNLRDVLGYPTVKYSEPYRWDKDYYKKYVIFELEEE
jgi:hypothetical protein